MKKSTLADMPDAPPALEDADAVFGTAAELFGLLSTPIRLRIISALCNGEKNVSQLLQDIETTQPNMSQHLATLYRAGVLGKRRDATQIYYRIASERAAMLCRAVCTQIATELNLPRQISVAPGTQTTDCKLPVDVTLQTSLATPPASRSMRAASLPHSSSASHPIAASLINPIETG